MKVAQYLKLQTLIGASGLLMASFFAMAQTAAPVVKPEIESTLIARRVEIDADKKEKLVDAKTAKPGEVIEYQATYANKGKPRCATCWRPCQFRREQTFSATHTSQWARKRPWRMVFFKLSL